MSAPVWDDPATLAECSTCGDWGWLIRKDGWVFPCPQGCQPPAIAPVERLNRAPGSKAESAVVELHRFQRAESAYHSPEPPFSERQR